MDLLQQFETWVTQNESLLSGLAALVVVVGVVLSPLGIGLRRITGGASGDTQAPDASGTSPTIADSQ
ncbi:MAG: hypothetical protein Cons2KO_18700 [Congregibacter sp.]